MYYRNQVIELFREIIKSVRLSVNDALHFCLEFTINSSLLFKICCLLNKINTACITAKRKKKGKSGYKKQVNVLNLLHVSLQ